MTHNPESLQAILNRFRLPAIAADKITSLQPGLSGAQVWQVATPWGSFCLKCMPDGFSVQRLTTIHHEILARRDAGMGELAGYCQTDQGQTYLEHSQRLWELQTWVKGNPAEAPYSSAQIESMLQAVARFHQIVRDTPHDKSQLAVSEGITTRLEMLRTWKTHRMPNIEPILKGYGNPLHKAQLCLFTEGFTQFQRALEMILEAVAEEAFLVETCIGDPRPENFRFDGPQVSGMFDFGSLRRDNLALDIARLASELSTDGTIDWDIAFDNIELIRPLKPAEKHLAMVLDAANVVLTGLKWVQWIVIDGYSFADAKLVTARLDHLSRRLRQLNEHPVWK